MTRWEYLTLTVPLGGFQAFDEDLNRLGHEGWEVVGIAATDRTKFEEPSVRIVAKRPIE